VAKLSLTSVPAALVHLVRTNRVTGDPPSAAKESPERSPNADSDPEIAGASGATTASGPPRSKVCAFCSVRRARFDHHCLWIDTCVHARSHRAFIATLALAVAAAAGFSALAMPHVADPPPTALASLAAAHALEPLTFAARAACAVVALAASGVLGMQLLCISRNRTLNEMLNRRRYYEVCTQSRESHR
jgi:hypothetical protein